MAEILPFRALYFNPTKGELSKVLSPPYDVISSEHQEGLYARHPRNVVRLEFGKEPDRYLAAERSLGDWLMDGTLVHDDQPAVYLLAQTFRDREGRVIRRKGFLALCKLEDPEDKTILPHEKTFPKPKEDRLKLLIQTKAQFSPIFSLYVDPSRLVDDLLHSMSKEPPLLNAEFEDVGSEVWRLPDTGAISKLQALLRRSQVFIADGHHRYETALEYRRTRRSENPNHSGSEGYNFTLMYLANIEDKGLVIQPIHRVVRGLIEFDARRYLANLAYSFDVEAVDSREELMDAVRGGNRHVFGIKVAGDKKFYLARMKGTSTIDKLIPQHYLQELRELDVVLLHAYLIPRLLEMGIQSSETHVQIDFVKDEFEAIAAVEKGSAQVAFLLNPTPVEQVQAVARAGLTMPQKSTYFYPKLPAGLLMYDLDHH